MWFQITSTPALRRREGDAAEALSTPLPLSASVAARAVFLVAS
jgi:hypothetical protein